jgi:hypothetical protein
MLRMLTLKHTEGHGLPSSSCALSAGIVAMQHTLLRNVRVTGRRLQLEADFAEIAQEISRRSILSESPATPTQLPLLGAHALQPPQPPLPREAERPTPRPSPASSAPGLSSPLPNRQQDPAVAAALSNGTPLVRQAHAEAVDDLLTQQERSSAQLPSPALIPPPSLPLPSSSLLPLPPTPPSSS